MNNFINAIKNLPRRGQHNLAKIVCLGFGLAVSAVLIGEVYFEQTFETWFPGHERTYTINEDVVQNGQYTSGPLPREPLRRASRTCRHRWRPPRATPSCWVM